MAFPDNTSNLKQDMPTKDITQKKEFCDVTVQAESNGRTLLLSDADFSDLVEQKSEFQEPGKLGRTDICLPDAVEINPKEGAGYPKHSPTTPKIGELVQDPSTDSADQKYFSFALKGSQLDKLENDRDQPSEVEQHAKYAEAVQMQESHVTSVKEQTDVAEQNAINDESAKCENDAESAKPEANYNEHHAKEQVNDDDQCTSSTGWEKEQVNDDDKCAMDAKSQHEQAIDAKSAKECAIDSVSATELANYSEQQENAIEAANEFGNDCDQHANDERSVKVYGPAGSTQELVHDARSAQKLVHDDESTQELVHDAESTQELVHDAQSTQDLVYDAESTQELVHDADSTQELIHDTQSTQELVHDAESTQELVLDAQSTQELVNDAQSTLEFVHDAESTQELIHDTQSTQELVHDAESTQELVLDAQSTQELVHDAESTQELVYDAESSHELINDAESTQELVHDIESTQELVHATESSHELIHDAESTHELVHDAESTQKLVHDAESTQELVHDTESTQEFIHDTESTKKKTNDVKQNAIDESVKKYANDELVKEQANGADSAKEWANDAEPCSNDAKSAKEWTNDTEQCANDAESAKEWANDAEQCANDAESAKEWVNDAKQCSNDAKSAKEWANDAEQCANDVESARDQENDSEQCANDAESAKECTNDAESTKDWANDTEQCAIDAESAKEWANDAEQCANDAESLKEQANVAEQYENAAVTVKKQTFEAEEYDNDVESVNKSIDAERHVNSAVSGKKQAIFSIHYSNTVDLAKEQANEAVQCPNTVVIMESISEQFSQENTDEQSEGFIHKKWSYYKNCFEMTNSPKNHGKFIKVNWRYHFMCSLALMKDGQYAVKMYAQILSFHISTWTVDTFMFLFEDWSKYFVPEIQIYISVVRYPSDTENLFNYLRREHAVVPELPPHVPLYHNVEDAIHSICDPELGFHDIHAPNPDEQASNNHANSSQLEILYQRQNGNEEPERSDQPVAEELSRGELCEEQTCQMQLEQPPRTLTEQCSNVIGQCAGDMVAVQRQQNTQISVDARPTAVSISETQRLHGKHKDTPRNKPDKKYMLAAGLQYTGHDDEVKCQHGCRLRGFEERDNPMEEHAYHFPYCPFVNQILSSREIHRILRRRGAPRRTYALLTFFNHEAIRQLARRPGNYYNMLRSAFEAVYRDTEGDFQVDRNILMRVQQYIQDILISMANESEEPQDGGATGIN